MISIVSLEKPEEPVNPKISITVIDKPKEESVIEFTTIKIVSLDKPEQPVEEDKKPKEVEKSKEEEPERKVLRGKVTTIPKISVTVVDKPKEE